MREADMVRRKAAGMNAAEVHAEIARVLVGMECAQSVSALKRYRTRYNIFQERSAEIAREKLEALYA